MAKVKSSNGGNQKKNFGSRKGGKAQKRRGPKDKHIKKYKKQGK
jgi:hypothetical protein